MTYPDGEVVTYGYNGLGDVETVTGATPYVTNVDYNASGQLSVSPGINRELKELNKRCGEGFRGYFKSI